MRSPTRTHSRAKALRASMSPPEVALWARLRVRRAGVPRFRRQHPVGPYIADFYCAAAKRVIEVDGYVHATADHPARDLRREDYLAGLGLTVMRYTGAEVLRDPDGVANSIIDAARTPPQTSA